MPFYETVEEASTRLNGTVFLYANQPAYCESVFLGDDGHIRLKITLYPKGGSSQTVKIDDPNIELYRYQLGYVNLSSGASYLSRLPSKGSYKQGLYRHNTQFTKYAPNGYVPEWNQVFKTPGFKDMLINKYPPFEEAVGRLDAQEGGVYSVAFNKNFAVHKDSFRGDVLLNYKGDKIGFGSDAFQVPMEFSHLREVIAKSGIKVR